MKTLELGFKAFDPHELLCHFLAERGGCYREADLRVELRDITFVPDAELPPGTFQASCGSALMAALKGTPQRVVFVAVDHPMFWLYAREGIDGVNALRGGRLATYPPVAPPWHFARMALAGAGLDPDADVTLVPARDDVARLGLLRSGDAEGAVLSSAVAPARVERLGYRRLACLGDDIRVPTTGLATHAETIEGDRPLVEAMVGAHRNALRQLHGDAEASRAVLEKVFDVDPAYARETAELYRACFTPAGRVDADEARGALELMGRALGIEEAPAWQSVYDPSFL